MSSGIKEAKYILDKTPPSADFSEFASAMSVVAQHVISKSIDTETYSGIVFCLLDKVAPRLASAALEQFEKASADFDAIFLNGNAAIAFKELTKVLNVKEESCEVAARTLILFIDKSLGAVDRMRQVLGSPDIETFLSAVVHLPSRIMAVLHAESNDNFNAAEIIEEEAYYSILAEALLLQPMVSDPQRDRVLSELLERMVKLKQSGSVISRWLATGTEESIVTAVLRAPQNCIDQLVRALLSTETDANVQWTKIIQVTTAVLRESPSALDACVNKVPFQRPLFKRPRTALKRLIKALEGAGGSTALLKALDMAAQLWSSEQFSKFADIQLQRQVTRILLYYMRCTSDMTEAVDLYGDDSVMLVLVDGVHYRLSDNDVRVQRLGMVIGEASSRYCKDPKPLTFERHGMAETRKEDAKISGDDAFEDGGDSDFSELATKVGDDWSDDESIPTNIVALDESNGAKPMQAYGSSSTASAAVANGTHDAAKKGSKSEASNTTTKRARSRKDVNIWVTGDTANPVESVEDDWSSLDSYELTDSSDEESHMPFSHHMYKRDYEAVRKKISAPFSIPRLLGLLREVNQSSGGALKVDAETTISTLRTVASRAEALFEAEGTTMHACAIELCLEVIYVDANRYPDEYFEDMEQARRKAIQRLLELDVVDCGVALVERIICGPTSDVGKRIECLGALSAGLRGAEERVVQMARERSEKQRQIELKRVEEEGKRRIGTVTKRMNSASNVSEPYMAIRRKWDDEGLGRVFDALAVGLCGGGGADFVDIATRDTQLWAQGIITLSVIACTTGISMEGGRMRHDVMEIAMGRVLRESEADAVVRRGCALALGAVVEKMTRREIEGFGSGLASSTTIGALIHDDDKTASQAAQWLQRATGDSDIGVRRFAKRTLHIWADRLSSVQND